MIRIAMALTFVLVASPSVLAQEQDSIPLFHAPPIVVSATRAPTLAEHVASSVTVIGREEIERRQIRTVLDALRDVPGVAIVRNGGPGGVTSAFLRGAGTDHALVLIDGVEVNEPSAPASAFDFAHLLTADVERIEVLRGPQSTLYGSSAMGGVIQIFTRSGGGPRHAAVSAEGGSYGTRDVTATASGSSGRLDYALSAADRRTNGISAAPADLGNDERDAHRASQVTARLGWRAAERIELGVTARGSVGETDIDRGTPTGDDPNFDAQLTELSGRAWVNLATRGGRWRQTLALAHARQERDTRDEPDTAHPLDRFDGSFDGARWTGQWLHEIELAGRVVGGVELEQEVASGSFTSESEFGPFAAELPEESAWTKGVFVHHESRWGPLTLGLGGRVDDHDRFGTAATMRVAPVLSLATGTRIRGTVGKGFKAPSLSQLFDPEFGNLDLDPERSLGWDVGVEQDLAGDRLRLGATLFSTDFEDLVGFEFPAGYRNVSAASTRGVEALASLLVRGNVRVRGSYAYTDARDESEGTDDSGLPLIRRPRHQGGVAIELVVSGRGDGAIELQHTGARDDKDFGAFPARRVTLDGYTLVRVAGSFAVSESLRVFARVENLLGTEYEELFGYGTPGRAAYGGLRAAF